MKRRSAAAAVVIAAVTGASIAEAAVNKGTFKGKTTAGDNVGFIVIKKNRIADFYFEGVQLTCTDGDKYDTGSGSERVQTASKARYKVSSSGKFSIKVRNDARGKGWDVKGQFASKGAKATGTISVFANYDITNNADPNGEVKCKSGNVKFTVARR
jgi:hypothetical protein